jgi:hypothetical protein
MATVKPNICRYSSTEGPPRRQQVVVSRLWMGYTSIKHAHRLSDEKIYKDDMMKTTTNKYGEGKNTTDGNTDKDDTIRFRNYEENI